jgi:hypothetical protein
MLFLSIYIFVRGFSLAHKEEKYCGIVVETQNQPYSGKHEIYYEQYILVNFDSIGMKAIRVDMTTFMSHKKGDKICFMLDENQVSNSTKHFSMFIFGLIATIILIFVIIGYIFNIQ